MQRTDLVRQRMGLPSLHNTGGQAPLSAREATGFDEPKGLIGWQVRMKSSIDHNFGGAVNEWFLSAYMSGKQIHCYQVAL